MLKLSGLDWTVETRPLFTCTGPKNEGGKLVGIDNSKAIVRATDHSVLGLVSDKYQPLQNSEAFAVLDSLVSDGSMRYHTAGSLRGGQRVWALGKVGSIEVVPNHRVDNFIFIYTGHDGITATRVLWTQVEVNCGNTARAALSAGRGDGLSVRHSSSQHTQLNTAARVLGLAQDNFEKSCEFLQRAARTKLTEDRWVKLAGELIPDPKEGRSNARAVAKREELTRLLFRGRGKDIPGTEGTLYAARGAVTEYCNFHRSTSGKNGQAQEKRFDASLFGSSATLIAKADELIAEILNASDLEPEPVDAVSLMSNL